jgi:hypothetical protein
MNVCDVGYTCGDDSTETQDELLAPCRGPAPDASRRRRDRARILLCDASGLVVMFSSLAAGVAR